MNVTLHISPALSSQLETFSAAENVTVEDFLLLAAAEKIAAIEHHTWLTHHEPAAHVDPCGED